jgi:glycosyltransferase involved in cell wall biosynthesis
LPLVIAGDGNFLDKAKALVREHKLENKVQFLGMLEPAELDRICRTATVAIGLIENAGPNQYMALPNKFFDYMHCGVPQLTMNYPAIKRVNDQYNIAYLVDDVNVETIATALNEMISNTALLDEMRANCVRARKVFNWQEEEKKLLGFYKKLTAE